MNPQLTVPKAATYWQHLQTQEEPWQLSGKALGYGVDDRGFEYRQGLGIFLVTSASRRSFLSSGYQGLFPWG
jgi:hypothetical protein